jgi:cytochrome c6
MRSFFLNMVLCISVVTIFATSCSDSSSQVEAPAAVQMADQTLTPDQVVQRYKVMCELCHGDDGKKAYAGAKDLSLSTLSVAERVAIIKYGKGQMTPFENRLSDAEIHALAEYLDQFK